MIQLADTILSTQPCKKLVVLLHGYGSNGFDLMDLAKSWQASLPFCDFLSPHALEASEVNPFDGYQWFSLYDFSPFNVRRGLDRAGPMLASWLSNELTKRQLAPTDLVLVGFSQGAMMALEMLYHFKALAGVIGYSGAFYEHQEAIQALSTSTPILLVHGMQDGVVSYQAFLLSKSLLTQKGCPVQDLSCPYLAHGINEEGVLKGNDFLSKALS
ncbi:MAG TPA: dienelactone hydrolase family protein [Alphaproteobacteria bacterium]|nr:dienelactone hydrolase family protein [Alphaproteobacteria bacterium]